MWSYFSNSIIYRVSLLGYGNMSGETMIFTVEGASQRKCLLSNEIKSDVFETFNVLIWE